MTDFLASAWFVLAGIAIALIIARLFFGPQQPNRGNAHHEPVKQFLRPPCGAFTGGHLGDPDYHCAKGANHLGAHEGFDRRGGWARWKFEQLEDGQTGIKFIKIGSP